MIGNGFDIAHGLKTGFEDFASDAQEQIDSGDFFDKHYRLLVESSGFVKYFSKRKELNCWVDVEKEIKKILDYVYAFMKTVDKYVVRGTYKLNGLNNYLAHILLTMKLAERDNSNHIIINPYLYNTLYGIKEEKVIEHMEKQLDSFIKCFEYYLSNIMPTLTEKLKPIKQIEGLEPKHVVSFNYTDTYEIYGISDPNITHIHGKIGQNNIVLGIDDEDEKELTFVAFKKYFQRIYKNNKRLDFKSIRKLIILDRDRALDAYFYGHSLDITDKEIITEIKNNVSKMRVFYYCEEDRIDKLKNIVAVFGKENAKRYLRKKEIELIEIL